jgi:CBS domain-containing protein
MLIGMISRSDLLKKGKVLKSIGNNSKSSVEGIMTTPAIDVSPFEGIDIAAKKMAKHNISRLPVTEEGRIVGILDRHDVLKALTL